MVIQVLDAITQCPMKVLVQILVIGRLAIQDPELLLGINHKSFPHM
jgi:hypothetical protein